MLGGLFDAVDTQQRQSLLLPRTQEYSFFHATVQTKMIITWYNRHDQINVAFLYVKERSWCQTIRALYFTDTAIQKNLQNQHRCEKIKCSAPQNVKPGTINPGWKRIALDSTASLFDSQKIWRLELTRAKHIGPSWVFNNRICQHCGMKTSMVTPSFYYVFNISLSCNINIPSFIGNLWWDLLLRNYLNIF